MATPAEWFDQAWKHHQAGEWVQAEQLYRQILQGDPRHADASCFLGAICQANGRIAEAEDHYRRAVELSPAFGTAWNSLGILLAQQGKLDEAASCFLHVLRQDPEDADAHNNLGLVRAHQGDFDLAIACYQRAVRIQPDYRASHANLNDARQLGKDPPRTAAAANLRGAQLANQGRLEEAKNCFYQALTIDSHDADALNNLSSALILQERFDDALAPCLEALRVRPDFPQAHHNLGAIREFQQRLDEALQSFQRALRLLPSYPEACYSLGNVFKRQGKLEDSLAAYRQAISLRPGYPDAHNNLAALLCSLGDAATAEKHYRQALQLRPNYPVAHNNLGVLLRDQGRFQEALDEFDKAIALQDDFAEVHYNRALVWLLQGDYERGWPEFAWRWRQSQYYQIQSSRPIWDGAPLEGKTILLHAEQGFGDTIQFIRYAALAKERGARVIVQCQPELQALLKTVPGVDVLLPWNAQLPAFDFHAPLLNVPGIFGTTLDTIPAAIPYLHADAELVRHWRSELASVDGFKIGIAWQGNPAYGLDRLRSIPLAQFAPIAEVPGVRLVSLQKRWGMEQVAEVASRFSVFDLGERLDEDTGAFLDTAAVMKNLDLVICSDSAVAHLAGALGTPVWLGLSFVPDWRWLLEREDSPWYPTMRLFRQAQPGIWTDVFERMADALFAFRAGQSKN